MLMLGCLAFLLFFLSDLNDHKLRLKPLALCFPLGALLLISATIISCVKNASPHAPAVKYISAGAGLICFALLIRSLFFSMPAGQAYIEREKGRQAVTGGLYALCRHPGVLFFIPTYLCISLAFGMPLYESAIYSLLNILLIIYEDIIVFPNVLGGYSEYKKSTPFLIPNRRSVQTFLNNGSSRKGR